MALGVNETLEVVKDNAKFKDKLEQLAKAEASAKAAMEKSRLMNIEVNGQFDQKRAELEELKTEQRTAVEKAMKPIENQKADLANREAAIVKEEKRLKGLVDKINYDLNGIKKQTAAIKDREVKFDERVKAFEAAAKRVGENA